MCPTESTAPEFSHAYRYLGHLLLMKVTFEALKSEASGPLVSLVYLLCDDQVQAVQTCYGLT